jgi:glycosyltransferase involved in cell wall biosynthesis
LNIVVGIPAYNESFTIKDVVSDILRTNLADRIIVVDDGSRDGTGALAYEAGALVISHKRNMGAGAATRTLLSIAKGRSADILVTIDGDGQHSAFEIGKIIQPIIEDQTDIVVGTRFAKDGEEVRIPSYRKIGLHILSALSNHRHGLGVKDVQCCFRAYGKRAINEIKIEDCGFGFSIETLVQARRLGLRIVEVPVSCRYDIGKHTTHPIVHGGLLLLAIARCKAKGG